jgi:hypothetical protein
MHLMRTLPMMKARATRKKKRRWRMSPKRRFVN